MTPEEAKDSLMAMNKESYISGAVDALETFRTALGRIVEQHTELPPEVRAGIEIALACSQVSLNQYQEKM